MFNSSSAYTSCDSACYVRRGSVDSLTRTRKLPFLPISGEVSRRQESIIARPWAPATKGSLFQNSLEVRWIQIRPPCHYSP